LKNCFEAETDLMKEVELAEPIAWKETKHESNKAKRTVSEAVLLQEDFWKLRISSPENKETEA
jgi:hypothetical protein